MPPRGQLSPPKTEEQEKKKKDLQEFIPNLILNPTNWPFKVWQISRNNKNPSQEQCSLKVDLAKIQSLDFNMVTMNVESLNFWPPLGLLTL